MSKELRAVITGAGSGLGRALALDIARRGGRSVISDVDEAGLAETATLVERAGSRAYAEPCDVTVPEQVNQLAARAVEHLGAVDLLANNAGVAAGGPFEDISLEHWEWIMGVNLWGVIHGCRAFLPAMKTRGRGYVLNVASAAGLVSFPWLSPYNVTKAGVVALSETLHGEYKKHGVNVSVLCPTFFTTNIARSARGPGQAGDRLQRSVERQMKRSKIQAPEVARMAIDGVLAGQLHLVPMRNGRVMWRVERAVPQLFYGFLGRRGRAAR